jgi:disulfide oxidoreductase YuzD
MKVAFSQSKLNVLFLFFLSTFIITPSSIYAFQEQSYKEYKGKVIDDETRKPLAFADISVDGTNISTITNKEGKFSLKIPNNGLNNSLTVSFLGYETLKVNLEDLVKRGNTIVLRLEATQLDQINISLPGNAKELVKKALSGRGEKYIKDRTLMTAFYRETIKKRKKNASLTEAVVKIFKQPYQGSRNDAVELIKSRKNTNYSRLDTIALKLQGGPFSALYSDVVKYTDYIFTEETFEYYDFSFNPTTEINDRLVYVIDFKQQANIVTPLYKGKLFIDANTLALISAEYELNVENKDEAVKLFLRKKPRKADVEPVTAKYKVDYKISNGKWYYSYSNLHLAFKVKWPKKLFSSTYTLDVEMAVTDWNNNLVARVNPENRIRPSIILSDEASGFSDPEFWGEYNIIEPEKSIESAIRKISRQLSRIERSGKSK